jgi:hypothetical protein
MSVISDKPQFSAALRSGAVAEADYAPLVRGRQGRHKPGHGRPG